jgi:SAM-dependent methyltransferase
MPSYTPDFFKALAPSSNRSAEIVAPILMELLQPRSVVDVGCGTGGWLSAFWKAGVTDVLGIDGNWVPRDQLQIAPQQFMESDLTQPLPVTRIFDLALSLEVAEHLPEEASARFVDGLTQLATVVMFSAAIPYQGGTAHVNEQWPTYWAVRFSEHGFLPVDCLRPQLWTDKGVEAYYAQNLLLFVRRDRLLEDPRLRVAWETVRHLPLDLVHPRQYLGSRVETAGLRRLLRAVPSSGARAVLRRLHTSFPASLSTPDHSHQGQSARAKTERP